MRYRLWILCCLLILMTRATINSHTERGVPVAALYMLKCNQLYIFLYPSSYVVHAEVNAILNTNHASAAGQVWLFQSPIPLYISFNFYKNFTGFLCFFSHRNYMSPCSRAMNVPRLLFRFVSL